MQSRRNGPGWIRSMVLVLAVAGAAASNLQAATREERANGRKVVEQMHQAVSGRRDAVFTPFVEALRTNEELFDTYCEYLTDQRDEERTKKLMAAVRRLELWGFLEQFVIDVVQRNHGRSATAYRLEAEAKYHLGKRAEASEAVIRGIALDPFDRRLRLLAATLAGEAESERPADSTSRPDGNERTAFAASVAREKALRVGDMLTEALMKYGHRHRDDEWLNAALPIVDMVGLEARLTNEGLLPDWYRAGRHTYSFRLSKVNRKFVAVHPEHGCREAGFADVATPLLAERSWTDGLLWSVLADGSDDEKAFAVVRLLTPRRTLEDEQCDRIGRTLASLADGFHLEVVLEQILRWIRCQPAGGTQLHAAVRKMYDDGTGFRRRLAFVVLAWMDDHPQSLTKDDVLFFGQGTRLLGPDDIGRDQSAACSSSLVAEGATAVQRLVDWAEGATTENAYTLHRMAQETAEKLVAK